MDAVIAFSPSTDSTLANPSILKNIETDPMLGPGLGPLARMPVALKALGALIAGQMSPRNPLMSPLFGDLSELPPTLVQASDCEMLFDDSVRYVNKARSQGSPNILGNRPGGPHTASEIFVAGDSAGGNLTLMLSAWARDENIRRMDAVIAFSPSTDSTLANPSILKNIETDPMLGPGLGPLARMPVALKALGALIAGQMSPRNPLMSPLFGDLSELPPTLVQASDCEMLFDDSVRYVNKARSHGSPVTLQIWPGMVHVWQMFQHVLPEAGLAIDEVAAFVQANSAAAPMNEASSG